MRLLALTVVALTVCSCRDGGGGHQLFDADTDTDANIECFTGRFRMILTVPEEDFAMCPEVAADIAAAELELVLPYGSCDENGTQFTLEGVEANGETADFHGGVTWHDYHWTGGARWLGPCTVWADIELVPL